MSRDMNRILSLEVSHAECFTGEIEASLPYHRMNGKQYCLPALTLYEQAEVDALQEAAERVDRIYMKVLRFAQRYLPDFFLTGQLGLHPALLTAARIEVPAHGISRQDWIIGPQGMKCIENNSDTPSGIPETAYAGNAIIDTYSSYRSASTAMRDTIQRAFTGLITHYAESGISGTIAFSSYGWHTEDRTNTEYIMEAVKALGYDVLYVPLEELEIIPNVGLFAGSQRISILYRLYPLEYLVHDTNEDGAEPVGEHLLDLVVQGRIGMINPVQSSITQSKGFMALIWSLYERRDETEAFCGFKLFDDDDVRTLESYFLPTYYEPSPFIQYGVPYAAKGYWGREGKGTALYDSQGAVDEMERGYDEAEREAVQSYYDNQPKIYQQLFPMEEVVVETEEGPYSGRLLTGAYVIGGTFAGLLPRIGGKITGDLAYFCPAAIHTKEE
ncbi:glutathionylspermidine synthase family protein [Paenibacillus sp. R14(2021)]|uniref:glutathionylspermidine synthase family protein n=1 Tax=Paenibacillus sp. R14(2021) TaxID=2859228 RepID=UPI002157D099|nr:glutathionylspermidine synthase family protein [Paenibacillus sp. R14(2021)]